jgi:hypothetical protein
MISPDTVRLSWCVVTDCIAHNGESGQAWSQAIAKGFYHVSETLAVFVWDSIEQRASMANPGLQRY